MSVYVEGNHKAFTTGEAIGQHILVNIESGVIMICGVNEVAIGTTDAAAASGAVVSVHLLSAAGTMFGVTDSSITGGAICYAQAAGKVSSSSATNAHVLGVAMASANSGDIIEFMPSLVGSN